MSPYELAVGLRYTRARKGSGRNTFISFISLMSMAGIALGVAALIGLIGTLIGAVGGVLLALNVGTVLPALERLFNTQFLDKTVYYINELPSDLQRGDVVTIALIALALALLATIYPAWRASKVNPAEALRYE